MILKLIGRGGGAYDLTDDGYVSPSGEIHRRLRGADGCNSGRAESLSKHGVICSGASPKHLLGSGPAAVLSRLEIKKRKISAWLSSDSPAEPGSSQAPAFT